MDEPHLHWMYEPEPITVPGRGYRLFDRRDLITISGMMLVAGLGLGWLVGRHRKL